jgi:ABC-type branched-subunit amino acid transport system ATPase component
MDSNPVLLEHNLPAAVRFTSNGLVLDGGTVVLSAPGTDLVRCVVISLPLGVMRLGQWQQGACRPDLAL